MKRVADAIEKEERMEDKKWWESVSIWMQILALISFALKSVGWVELDAETQATLAQNLAALATSAMIVVGIIITVVRRFKKDTKPIARKII